MTENSTRGVIKKRDVKLYDNGTGTGYCEEHSATGIEEITQTETN